MVSLAKINYTMWKWGLFAACIFTALPGVSGIRMRCEGPSKAGSHKQMAEGLRAKKVPASARFPIDHMHPSGVESLAMSSQSKKYVTFGAAIAVIVLSLAYLAYTGVRTENLSYYKTISQLQTEAGQG